MTTEHVQNRRSVGEIPEEWKIVRLGKLIKITKGKKPNSLLDEKKEFCLPYLTADSMRNNLSSSQWCGRNDPNVVKVRENEVILIWDGSNSGDVFIGFEGALASTMVKIKTSQEIDDCYLYYFLKTKFNYLNGTTSGTGIPHVSKAIIENLQVPLPPVVEQQKISEVLNSVEEAIQTVDVAIAKTERLKKGLMQKLLIEGIGHEDYKETEVGKIPKEWNFVKIGEIADLESGGTPSRKQPKYWDGPISWLKSGELNDGKIYVTEEKITELGLRESAAKIFSRGTLLIALYGRGTVSKTAILEIDSATNQAIAAIIPKNRAFEAQYMQHCLIFFRNRLLNQLVNPSSDVGRTNIYLNTLKLFKIPLPSLREQQAFSQIISTVDRRLILEKRRKKKLERVKKGLMNELLTGRRRVKVAM